MPAKKTEEKEETKSLAKAQSKPSDPSKAKPTKSKQVEPLPTDQDSPTNNSSSKKAEPITPEKSDPSPNSSPSSKPSAPPKKPSSKALEALKKKAAELESKVEDLDTKVDLKKKLKPEEEEETKETLVPMEDYLKSSIHLGTRVITPDMRPYVYRRRADGLAVFNTARLDDEIRAGADYLSKFSPEQIVIVCKREAGWKPVQLFSKITGIKAFTKKYPPGVLTNTNLEDFTEKDLVLICDPWIDKNALTDANKIKIPVLSICDTNNYTSGVSQIIPGNNKSAKSLGMIFYLLTKIYIEKRKLQAELPPVQEFIEDWENLQPPK